MTFTDVKVKQPSYKTNPSNYEKAKEIFKQ